MKKIVALILVALCIIFAFTSCAAKPNGDSDIAKEKLEEAGYHVYQSRSIMDSDDYEGIVDALSVSGNRGVNNISLTICYFESDEAADKAWDNPNVQNHIRVAEETTWIPDTFVAKKVGNIIYYGDKEMVKDAK